MNDLLAENHFSTLLSRKNANFLSYAISQKPWYREKKEKKVFESTLSKKKQILKQVFNNASDFESRISKYVRFSVNFKQLVIFGIGILSACQILKHLFTTRQILIRNFNNATDFYVKLVLKKEIFLDNLFSNNLPKHVWIQADLKQLVSFWIRTFAACQF